MYGHKFLLSHGHTLSVFSHCHTSQPLWAFICILTLRNLQFLQKIHTERGVWEQEMEDGEMENLFPYSMLVLRLKLILAKFLFVLFF